MLELNKEKSVDGRYHYFQFQVTLELDNKNIRNFRYIGGRTIQ
ncbi:DUF5960 family protein [Streptococcus agalactiae]